ncbi:MAG: signal peptidase II [Candidatus Omnitrophica bacterium]|nr:signal peptidase II [Candidatus Omnitrophota bacterium]
MTRSQLTIFISFFTITAIVFLDRISKIFFSQLLSLGESIPAIRNVFHLTLVHNTGIAFGLFKNQGIVFVVISAIAILLFSAYLYLHREDEHFGPLYIFAFSLIIGGALGNLIDRVCFGYVIDFIDFQVWPVFNLADSAITIGTIIILMTCIPFFSK